MWGSLQMYARPSHEKRMLPSGASIAATNTAPMSRSRPSDRSNSKRRSTARPISASSVLPAAAVTPTVQS